MGVYSNTAANAYADKIKAAYEYLSEIRKVSDRLTPVENLEAFQTQIQGLYDQLDLLVEASNLIVTATPTGEAILTGSVASIQALLQIGILPDDLVHRAELDAALANVLAQIGGLIAPYQDQLNEINTTFDTFTQFYQTQQSQISGLQIATTNLATGVSTNQSNLTTAVSRLTLVEGNAALIDTRLDSIDQNLVNVQSGLQATNDIVSGHSAEIQTIGNTITLHTSSIDSLASELVNTNSGVTANSTAISEMTTTISGMGDDIISQSQATTALKSVIGGSGNLLPNADFAAGANGWQIVVAEEDWASSVLTVDTFNMPPEVHCLEVLGTPTPDGQIVIQSPKVLIEQDKHYIISGYPCVDNGVVSLSYKVFNNAMNVLGQDVCPPTFNVTTNNQFSAYTRTFVKLLAPADATSLHLYLTVTGDGDFVTQAALFRPMIEEGWVDQVGPSAWTPNISGVPEALATAVQSLETEVSSINGNLTALSSSQTSLEARMGTAETALVNEMITSANKHNAMVAVTNQLSAELEDLETATTAQGSALSTLQTQMSIANGTITSQSSQLTSLQAQVDSMDSDTGGFGSAISSLDTRVISVENAITSQSAAITALQSSVTSANKIFAQNDPPPTEDRLDGDLWIDTDGGNKVYTLTEGMWVPRPDMNRNRVFVQPSQPTADNINDLWIETDAGNKPWRWNGTTWVDITDTRTTANASAITALETRTTAIEGVNTSQAGAITTLNSSVANAQSAANAAAAAASSAQASADTALNLLTEVSSDSLLTPSEKPVVIRERDILVTERSGIDAQATAYGITTEKTTYDNAVSALVSYLATLTTPTLWSNLSGNTTIVGTTFRQKFINVYVSRQALLNKILANTKTSLSANASAISALTTRVTSAEGTITSQSSQITTLQNTVNNGSTGVVATANAVSSLTTRVSAVEGVNSSQATSLTTLSTTVGNHTATINSHQTSIDGVLAKAGITLDVNGFITGWSLNNNGSSGSMAVRADSFQVVSPAGGARTEYSNGNWRVYDANGVLRVALGINI